MEKVEIIRHESTSAVTGYIELSNQTLVQYGKGFHYEKKFEAEAAALRICTALNYDALNNQQAALLAQTQPDRLTIAAMISIESVDGIPPSFAKVIMGFDAPDNDKDRMIYYIQAETTYRLMLADELIAQSQKS